MIWQNVKPEMKEELENTVRLINIYGFNILIFKSEALNKSIPYNKNRRIQIEVY